MLINHIRTFRQKQGLTQAQLAERTGIAQPDISDIESGKRSNPRLWTAWRISKALNVPIRHLFEEK